MKAGVSIPQFDIGADAVVLRDFAQAAEAIGYSHVALYDHAVGVNAASRPDWKSPYHSGIVFHDVFVLFGFLAAYTKNVELTTQVLVLPQRQTVIVAKQAASLDYLSGGRLRLAVGVGWNEAEYVALGEDFKTRGAREEEQAQVMKALWSNANVSFKGRWHDIPDVGLNPLPKQQPMPLWFGGHADETFNRIARWGDGWVTLQHQPHTTAPAAIAKLRERVRAAGRPESSVGIDAWISIGGTDPEVWRKEVAGWKALGATHVTLNTTFGAYHHRRIEGRTPQAHLEAMTRFHEAVKDLL